jgi:hypothetical protein
MYELDRCVFTANGETQAQQVCAFLRSSGIRSKVRGESIRKVHGLSVGELGAVEILVSEADEDEARNLLRSVEAGEFQIDESTETET